MTPQERVGKRLFLILATLMVLGKLGGVWHGLFGHGAVAHWLIPLSLALSIPFLWQGYAWLRWLVGGACVLSGGLVVFACGRDLAEFGVFESSIVFRGVLGLVDVLAGLAFLFLPSLSAFFRYQREGSLTGMARDDRLSPTLPNRRRFFPQLVAAGGWGLALGCGGGVLLSAYYLRSFYPVFSLGKVALVGVVAGGLVGVVAGLAVGAAQPKTRQRTLRLTVTRGLIAAGACVITLAVFAAISSGLSGFPSATHMGAPGPGLVSACIGAMLTLLNLGPQVAVVGFVLGGAVALLIDDS